jgi:hypothetical protein
MEENTELVPLVAPVEPFPLVPPLPMVIEYEVALTENPVAVLYPPAPPPPPEFHPHPPPPPAATTRYSTVLSVPSCETVNVLLELKM